MIHAETHKKNHVKKHFADGQLTTATKSQYKLYTHIPRLHEIMLVVVQHMSKTKYVITYVTILFLHCIRCFSSHTFLVKTFFIVLKEFQSVVINCSHILLLLNGLFTEDKQILKNSFTN